MNQASRELRFWERPRRLKWALSGLIFSAVFSCAAAPGGVRSFSSPDGHIKVVFHVPDSNSVEKPKWSAIYRGRQILTNCELGLATADLGELMTGLRLDRERRRSEDRRIPMLFGKASQANDRFNENRFVFRASSNRIVEVVFRCYDDAIALRYELPGQGERINLAEESTSFGPDGDPTACVQYLEHYRTSHEHNVSAVSYSNIRSGTLMDMPLTLRWKDGICAAITEAALRHYAGMSLVRSNVNGSDVLVCRLTPRPDGTKVVRPLPLQTPWRVVLIGDRPGALLESTVLYCLNEPLTIKDASWIKPGKITFSWWNGDVYDGSRGAPILSLETAKKYIDFCARHNIPTHSVIADETVTPWYHQSNKGVAPGPDTDVTKPRADLDLESIRRYAKSQNVRLWTWVHQGALRGRVEEAFAAFENLGWSGMMVDFFDHDDQDSIEFAEQILEAAARHRILIHFHGVWKPTGLERTYPNLMNHEGALNLEYLKWSDRCTPEHNLMMAFTRLVAGPIDYHLGGFRSVNRSEFKPLNIAPNVLGTRAHHLALYVCFDNPNPMLADYPTAYENQVGFDFLKQVPTWWDETRILEGEIGELLVTARRKGHAWYLGGISAKRPHQVQISLSFLRSGPYTAQIWKDASDAEANPNHLAKETLRITRKDSLKVELARDGGFVANLEPARK